MNQEEIKNYWDECALKYGTDIKATSQSSTFKELEISVLYQTIREIGNDYFCKDSISVLEVGCGNGINCNALSDLFSCYDFTGIDISNNMIKSAKELNKENKNKFYTGNILNLDIYKFLLPTYDIVFTDRCLINLSSIQLQEKAFYQLVNKVSSNGYLILIENTIQQFEKQNELREFLGLKKRTVREHNLLLDEDGFIENVTTEQQNLVLIKKSNFSSLHDFLVYILLPSVEEKEYYDDPLVKNAVKLIQNYPSGLNSFGDFGQNQLFVFKKYTL